MTQWVDAQVPEKLLFFFAQGPRYKIARGGRGSAKSRTISTALAVRGAEQPLRWLCARETQKSLKYSSRQILVDAIERIGLTAEFTILEDEIKGNTVFEVMDAEGIISERRTVFIFAGIREMSVDSIKSLEDFDGIWISEAHNLSEESWKKITPTFRHEAAKWRVKGTQDWNAGSDAEIWADYNPEFDEDFIHTWSNNPPANAIVAHVNYWDNPWFPEVLRADMEHMKLTDPTGYENVWEGKSKNSVVGAIYESEMAKAKASGRIVETPGIGVDRRQPVDVFFDLGHGDATAIWFAQQVNNWINILNFHQDRGKSIEHYAAIIEREAQDNGYLIGTYWLPWDGVSARTHHNMTGTNKRSPEQVLRSLGKTVRVAAMTDQSIGISTVRSAFPQFRFNEPKCRDGIRSLRMYQWGPKPKNGNEQTTPKHDEHSHPADALRTLASCIQEVQQGPVIQRDEPQREGDFGWG